MRLKLRLGMPAVFRESLAVAAALCVCVSATRSAGAADGGAQEIGINGSTTVRYEYYNYKGDPAGTSYTEEGKQWYGELQLSLDQSFTEYNSWRLDAMGLFNRSDYRTQDRNGLLEQLRFAWENGDAALPFRLELGDVYADLSYRSMSRSLKGVQLDLQPTAELFGGYQSILLFAGVSHGDWHDLDDHKDESGFVGASWLLDGAPFGSLSLNWAFNERDAGGGGDGRDRENVLSLAHEKVFDAEAARMTLESEISRHFDEPDNDRKDDTGMFVQFSTKHKNMPLTHRLRYERYGDDFQPEAANASTDRQSWEAHASWTFQSGVVLKGRSQFYEDSFQSANQTNTSVYGASLTGPFLNALDPKLSPSLDAYLRLSRNEDCTTDSRSEVLRAACSRPITELWSADGSVALQADKDCRGNTQGWSDDFRLSATRRLSLWGWDGSISPGVTYRYVQQHTGSDSRQWLPTLAADLTRGPHFFNLSANASSLHQLEDDTVDTDDYTAAATYGCRAGPHALSLEYEWTKHAPEPGAHTRGYKVALQYTYQFGLVAKASRRGVSFRLAPQGRPAYDWSADKDQPTIELLAGIEPGQPIEAVRERLKAEQNVTLDTSKPQYDTVDLRLLDEIDQRQRLILKHRDGKITTAALIVDLADVGSLDTVEQTFVKVRTALARTFGQPANFFEDGDFTRNLRIDLARGQFARVYEWFTPAGVIRLGIPRRLDHSLRIEIHHAKTFPPARQSLWGLEATPTR